MGDIKRVLSHEQVRILFGGLSESDPLGSSRNPYWQALGQCRQFLATYLPAAQLVKVPSTAAAAEAVSTRADDGAADSAAICSKICLQLFGNIETLQEGIQDSHGEFKPDYLGRAARWELKFLISRLLFFLRKDNFTRFYILANHPSSPLPYTRSNGHGERNALIRLEVLQTAESESQDTPIVTVSDLLAALRLPVLRVDRRPSTSAPREQFGSVYLLEVMDDGRWLDGRCADKVGIKDLPSWKERVLGAITRVAESGGRATLLGTW
jgi:hypothetical protein